MHAPRSLAPEMINLCKLLKLRAPFCFYSLKYKRDCHAAPSAQLWVGLPGLPPPGTLHLLPLLVEVAASFVPVHWGHSKSYQFCCREHRFLAQAWFRRTWLYLTGIQLTQTTALLILILPRQTLRRDWAKYSGCSDWNGPSWHKLTLCWGEE